MNKFFAKDFWLALDTHIWRVGVYCLAVTIIWILVSIGLYSFEGERSYFEIKPVLQFKILLAAVIFLGRYLLFPNHRKRNYFKWLFFLVILIIIGTEGIIVFKEGVSGLYLVFRGIDTVVWGIYITALLEVLGVFYHSWLVTPEIHSSGLPELWQLFWDELIKIGILLTLLAGLIYFYLSSFYLIDTTLYSYLFLIPVVATGVALFGYVRTKINKRIRQELRLIDHEVSDYLEWYHFEEEAELGYKLIRLQYLLLIRGYLVKINKPAISLTALCSYILCSGFILCLPYIFGLVVEVGSFK